MADRHETARKNQVVEFICGECGGINVAQTTPGAKPRSPEQHARYFKVMQLVYDNWPDTHPEQFASCEEMRKWLQMKAGHYEIAARIPLHGMRTEMLIFVVTTVIRAVGEYAVPRQVRDELIIFRPKSIAFNKMGHLNFCALNNAVDDIIRSETGLDPEQLLADAWRLKIAEKTEAKTPGKDRAKASVPSF